MGKHGLPVAERVRNAIWVDDSGCWLWQMHIDRAGYGRLQIRVNGKPQCAMAHRLAYAAWRGEHETGLELDHLCRVRRCVNPDHLEPVTHAENMRRSPVNKAARLAMRKSHCPHGHPYDEANTYIDRRGKRNCRTCMRVGAAERYRAGRERQSARAS